MKPGFYFLLFLSFLFFSGPAFAQKLTAGLVQKTEGRYEPNIHGEDEERLYVTAERSGGKYFVEAFDKKNKLTRIYSTPIDHEKIGKSKVELERVSLLADRFIVFYSYYDKLTGKSTLFARSVDKATGKMSSKRQDILVTDENPKKKKRRGFNVNLSPDRSKIFIQHYAHNPSDNNLLQHNVLLDQEMDKLFEATLKKDDYLPRNFVLDNDGSLFYVVESGMQLYINSYDATLDYDHWREQVTFEDQPSKFIFLQNMIISVNKKNELIVSGIVSEIKDKKYRIYGSAFVSIDRETKQLKVARINQFEESFYEQFKSNKDIKKGREATVKTNFDNEKIVKRQDGGIVMSMEIYQGYYTTESMYIEYGDILVMNFEPDGSMAWANRVPKRQVFSYGSINNIIFFSSRGFRFLIPPNEKNTVRYFSYSTGIFGDNLMLVHNDLPKNILLNGMSDRYKKYKKPGSGQVVRYYFDMNTGERKKELYADWAKTTVRLTPDVSYQKNEDSDLYLFGRKGSNFSYVRLSN